MRNERLKQAQVKLKFYETLSEYFEKKLKTSEPSLKNSIYLKSLVKLSEINQSISKEKRKIKLIKRQNRLDKRIIVALNSRVKLVSVDFEVVLWVDANNVKDLIGKGVGEIVNLYNANFRIAQVY